MTTPLRDKTPLFIDIESYLTSQITLKKMSLRRYMAASHLTKFAFQLGRGTDVVVVDPKDLNNFIPFLRDCMLSDEVVTVAHNSAFDVRWLRYDLGLPWPKHELCTMDLSQAAFPNQPGGYSLDNLTTCFPDLPQKLHIDLTDGKHTDAELNAYNARDVEACAALYDKALSRIGDNELWVAHATAKARNLSIRVDKAKGITALDSFAAQIQDYAERAAKNLLIDDEADIARVFGLDAGKVRSIRYDNLKQQLSDALGFDTKTTSKKKLNPTKLAANPDAAAVIEDVSKAGSMLTKKRLVSSFITNDVVDLNLNYFGSHTGRWTSRSDGKGVNFLNLPKHDKAVAPLIRGMLSLDNGYALVRGDAASLEYRVNCLFTGCAHGVSLFSNDVFADAYSAFGEVATGIPCAKSDPIRQLWKMCVLGLGFLMYPRTHALNLAKMLAQQQAWAKLSGKPPAITLDTFKDAIAQNRWTLPSSKYYDRVRRETGLDPAVINVAHNTHALFHRVHPEFQWFADWLDRAVSKLSRTPAHAADHILDRLYSERKAPDRGLVELFVDDSLQGRSILVRCGPWHQPTLCWRDVGVRKDVFGDIGMCSVKAGNRGYRKLTENILIENVVQAGGRNAIATGLEMLYDQGHGYPYILNVHDEVLLAVPNTPGSVVEAHGDLLRVFQPGGEVAQTWGWACVMDPTEVNVSHSLWEEDVLSTYGKDFWQRLAAGDQSLLDSVA